MNKKQYMQTVFALGELPDIIANKVTFGEMEIPERRGFYKLVNKTLKENGYKHIKEKHPKVA